MKIYLWWCVDCLSSSLSAITMFKIYHGCDLVNVDGTRKLIEFERGERCIRASDYPFWKSLEDCEHTGVKIRYVIRRDRLKKADKWTRNRYFCKLDKKNANDN